jgi:hypothetical protein
MDFRLTDEELLKYNLLEAPFFSIPMPFALATYVADALDKADLESMSMDAAASVLIFKHLLIEHAMNNHPYKEKTND